MKVLIIYATVEGQTRKIAQFIQEFLQENGHTVDALNVNQHPSDLKHYDAILIGSSIHMKKFDKDLRKFVVKNVELLNQKPCLFFSVSLTMASGFEDEVAELSTATQDFLTKTAFHPTKISHWKGAIRFSEYNYFKKIAMRMIAEKHGEKVDTHQDYEYTDWDEIKKETIDFVEK